MLKLLDFFFTGFHTILILFNLFGWIFPATRRLNLIVLVLTGGSWFILGIFYGIGYCPLTDWHFTVLQKLGYISLPDSYITFLLQRFSGHPFNQNLIDTLTLVCYFAALIISLRVNLKRKRK
jgi:hypothetical protein